MSLHEPRPRLIPAGLVLLAAPAAAQGPQVTFSVDWQGPTIAVLDAVTGTPITEADILTPGGGFPGFGIGEPQIAFTGGDLDLPFYTPCVGHLPGDPCGVEIDALSYGQDLLLSNMPGIQDYRILFSTDEFAVGVPAVPAPSVGSEGPIGDLSADVFTSLGLNPGPLPPMFGIHRGLLDGDGMFSGSGFAYQGLGIIEPNPPAGPPPDLGDNLDAFDFGPPHMPGMGIFFSLDAGFFDPLVGVANSDSAVSNGVLPGDVVQTVPGGNMQMYAAAGELGLDLFGPGSDDLDALILVENGIPGYQVSNMPYDWQTGATDQLIYSVRRGSAVIGQPDSIFGLPIREGDLLVPPCISCPPPPGVSGIIGGIAGIGGPPTPGIFIAGENLGLDGGDDLTAADARREDEVLFDCNNNGVEDSEDIANGTSSDANMNGIPCECESPGSKYCFCESPKGPCGNDDAAAGCENSTGSGGLLEGSGSSSVSSDDLALNASSLPRNKSALWFMGGSQVDSAFGDGRRCAGAPVQRWFATTTGAMGQVSLGDGLKSIWPIAGGIVVGDTWNFQLWHRDQMGPCGSGWNLTNGVSVTFTP